ncbi:heterokaryon incompatibility protein-domain-containing protein [Lophiotrema nucula]|uniref:Heterokaryon incompatibility protein-domain-containing protein n=1 Tax=Lophiotrema nucula TaxID=690887 RepID=A0A6A5Z375_9PLEO|nr:heterokaryon incompatibility protein-domain-containing protein [Lophiotrema nucula]
MENPYAPGSIGPDGWPIVPDVAPAPGHGREGLMNIPYHHLPLDPMRKEIRLVHITQRRPHPNQPEYYQLRAELSIVSLLNDPPPVYKALSYVWNEQMPMPDAQGVNNFLNSQHRVLKMALKELSNDGEELTLWVDALCINQADDEEKASQVAMMADIYQGAEEVIAWLGLESKTIRKALDVVEVWAAFALRHQEQPWFADFQSSKGKQRSQLQKVFTLEELVQHAREEVPQGFDEMKSGSYSESMVALGIMTYWSRAWIFQELAFASKCRIQNGARHTSLATIITAMKAWKAISEATKKIEPSVWDASIAKWHFTSLGKDTGIYGAQFGYLRMYTMLAALSRARTADHPVSFKGVLTLDMLKEFSGFDATDPRDKIFALWGFVDPDSPYASLLMPDYSLSVQEVFARATRYVILTQESLDILEYHSHGENRMNQGLRALGFHVDTKEPLKLPSWVPDWRLKIVTDFREDIFTPIVNRKTRYETCGFTDVVEEHPDDNLKLRLNGEEIGKVKESFTDDVFPYPVASGEPQMNHVRNLRNFVRHFVLRDQGILCQYLRQVYGTMDPDLSYESAGEPLNILAKMAHADPSELAELGTVHGKVAILLLLISVLDPVIKMIYSQSAGMRDWFSADLADVPPTVVVLLKLLTEETKASDGKNTIMVSFFGDELAPIVMDSEHASLNDIALAHRDYRQRSIRWTGIASKLDIWNSIPPESVEEDADSDLLERAVQLSLESNDLHLSSPSASERNGLDSSSIPERQELDLDRLICTPVEEHGKMNYAPSWEHNPSIPGSNAGSGDDTVDDTDDELAHAIRFSLQEDDNGSCVSNEGNENPFHGSASNEQEDEDLARAIQLSLEQDDPVSVNDLQDFHWLTELVEALSAPGESRVSSLRTAIQAIFKVKEAEALDHARQQRERPDQPVWKTMWYQGRCPHFFITEDGKLGAYSPCLSVRANDVVVKFAAGDTSYLLRPLNDGSYQFIGKCITLDQGTKDEPALSAEMTRWFEVL